MYGLAFTAASARQNGVNPVWYVSMSSGQRDGSGIARALDTIRDEAVAAPGGFAFSPAARVLPFCEPMGTWQNNEKEFSWEREWRHLGDFHFAPSEVALVFCPEPEIAQVEADGDYRAVDPSWSLEKMVDHLRHRPRVSQGPVAGVLTRDRRVRRTGARPPIFVAGANTGTRR